MAICFKEFHLFQTTILGIEYVSFLGDVTPFNKGVCFFSRIQLFPWSIPRFFLGVAGGTKLLNGQRSLPIVSSCDRTTKTTGGKGRRKVGGPCPSSTMSLASRSLTCWHSSLTCWHLRAGTCLNAFLICFL